MRVKIGCINFFKHDVHGDIGLCRLNYLIPYFNAFGLEAELGDCLTEECDIVFYSLWGPLDDLKKVKGNPKFLYWTDENECGGADLIYDQRNPYNYYKNGNYSMSFYQDYDDNIYFPIWLMFDYYEMLKYKKYGIKYEDKPKFASFIASNGSMYMSQYRNSFVNVLSKDYKTVDCMGSCLHNTDFYLPYDVEEAVKVHEPYKFNICFENSATYGSLTYITEKIVNAYKYNTIPIYWGAKNVATFFNANSFINAYDRSFYDVIDEIKKVDQDKELFEYMINQNPMVDYNKDYFMFFVEKLVDFIKKIVNS